MQPYFFPYLGYFDLINRANEWIVFDIVKFKSKTWMTRNRILNPKGEIQYINADIKKRILNSSSRINEVCLVSQELTRDKVKRQLEHYRSKNAPYFKEVMTLIDNCFEMPNNPSDSLLSVNTNCLNEVCKYLKIDFNFRILSQIDLSLPKISKPGDWALEITSALGYKSYINPPNGVGIFTLNDWEQRGITISFTKLINFKYEPYNSKIDQRLSILDVLMWNDPESIKNHLDSIKTQFMELGNS